MNDCSVPLGHLFRFVKVEFTLHDEFLEEVAGYPCFCMNLGQFILRFECSYRLLADYYVQIKDNPPLRHVIRNAIQIRPEGWKALHSLTFFSIGQVNGDDLISYVIG